MKLLLDTHLLLWAAEFVAAKASALPEQARLLIIDETNDLNFSPVSIWEVAIKTALGRPEFNVDPRLLRRALRDNGYVETPITSEHTAAVVDLPPIHKDPFDRLLIAQARAEGATLVTADAELGAYGGSVLTV